jgi:hypothetical protein
MSLANLQPFEHAEGLPNKFLKMPDIRQPAASFSAFFYAELAKQSPRNLVLATAFLAVGIVDLLGFGLGYFDRLSGLVAGIVMIFARFLLTGLLLARILVFGH